MSFGTQAGDGWLVHVPTSVISGDNGISESFNAAAAFNPPTRGSLNFSPGGSFVFPVLNVAVVVAAVAVAIVVIAVAVVVIVVVAVVVVADADVFFCHNLLLF